VAKEDERNERPVQGTFNTHKPVLLVATMAELRDAHAARRPNPFINKGSQ